MNHFADLTPGEWSAQVRAEIGAAGTSRPSRLQRFRMKRGRCNSRCAARTVSPFLDYLTAIYRRVLSPSSASRAPTHCCVHASFLTLQFSGGYVSDYDRDVTGEWLQPRQQPSSAPSGAGSGSGDCFPWECPSGSGSSAAASAGSSRSDSGSHEGNPDWIRGVGAPSPSSDPNTKQSANLRRAAASPVVQPSERPFESTSYSGWKGFTNTWLWTKPIIAGSPSPTNSPTPSITPSSSPSPSISSVPSPSGSPSSAPRPESVDWSSQSLQAVSPVRAQGSCGACFAFASAQALESATKIKTGILPVLSDQQLLDCGAGTCAGGGIRATWNYIKDAGGMCAGSAYPYTGVKASCMASTCTKQATVSSFLTVQRQSQAALEYAVALQPVVTPIQADQADFMFYSGGIMDGTCGTALNHAVVVVGYGTDGATGKKYWKIKNSWGPSWGENGYVRISRGDQWNPTGQCGIQMDPTIPVI